MARHLVPEHRLPGRAGVLLEETLERDLLLARNPAREEAGDRQQEPGNAAGPAPPREHPPLHRAVVVVRPGVLAAGAALRGAALCALHPAGEREDVGPRGVDPLQHHVIRRLAGGTPAGARRGLLSAARGAGRSRLLRLRALRRQMPGGAAVVARPSLRPRRLLLRSLLVLLLLLLFFFFLLSLLLFLLLLPLLLPLPPH